MVEVIVSVDQDGCGEVASYGYTLTKAGEYKSGRQLLFMGDDVEGPFLRDALQRFSGVTS